MYNYSRSLSFLAVDLWENGDGFCFHSEHALGYFIGFYHVAIPDHMLLNAELSDNVRKQNPHGYSEISTSSVAEVAMSNSSTSTITITSTTKSQCRNSKYQQCNRDDMICRNIQPHQMIRMFFDNVYFEDDVKMNLQLLRSQQQNESITFDVISIGSLLKPHLQNAQEATFGLHSSIRHWFRINERNDTDTTCSTTLSTEHMETICRKCNRVPRTAQKITRIFRKYIFQPKKHAGWLCAQKRPIDGLHSVLQKYKKQVRVNQTQEPLLLIPQYLAIIDDDTYLNLNYLTDVLPENFPSHEAYVITGCPLTYKFTFPYGGFGTILSRRAVENLLRPIHCAGSNVDAGTERTDPLPHTITNDLFNTLACWRLKQNTFGEKSFFEDGMSVSDLMYAYSSGLLFTKVDEWKNGIDFCFHSDHALGYFLGFYHIAVTDEKWISMELEMENDPTKQVDSYLNDELRQTYSYKGLSRDSVYPADVLN